jgi:thioredoxin reductase (NADPH)
VIGLASSVRARADAAAQPPNGDARAARPAIVVVDDEPAVARAVERDLRRRYGQRFRVLRAESGGSGLELVRELRRRGARLALIVADQRMPGVTGVDLLSSSRGLYPDARRVLLTAYADTEAAIRAINEVGLDFYLLKPWDPPEEKLYPMLDDLLGDWEAASILTAGGLRVIGHRWSRDSYELRDFLTRNRVPHRWFDLETDTEAQQLLEVAGVDAARVPVVLFEDGSVLEAPSQLELAERVGIATEASLPFYDLVIVGGGPAGLAAAVYGASEGLRTVLVEREATGGQAGQSSRIENYLGFPHGLSGSDLASRAEAQARRFGAEILRVRDVSGMQIDGPARTVVLAAGGQLQGHAVLIASGVAYMRLGAPGVDELTGAGVFYGAAMSEAVSCRDREVYVVGGANSAGQGALYLATEAAHVTILVRGEALSKSMSHYLVERIEAHDRIAVRTRTQVAGADGDGRLQRLRLSTPDGEEAVDADALFVFIGAAPCTEWVGDAVARDEKGFVLSGPQLAANGRRWPLERDPYLLETSVPGVFVAGDVRHRSIKRVASAVGEGSMAVQFVHQYLARE